MNTAKTNHFGRRLISLLLAVMLIASLCVSGIGSFSAVTVNKAATGEDQVVYKLVDTITVGNEYLIVNTNEAGDAFALKNNGGTSGGTSMAAESVKILSADIDADSTADLFIADAAEDIVWQTTENGEFSVELVNCLGSCALAPVMVVDGNYHNKLRVEQIPGIIESYAASGAEEVTAND